MQLYIYSDKISRATYERLKAAISEISRNTDTSNLVVAFYLSSAKSRSRGTAYVNKWMKPANFHSSGGYWAFTTRFGTPGDLPPQYRLIKLYIDPSRYYPRTEYDIYQWKWHYKSLVDHAALLFAHELHHYRRYHLGFHNREGEHAANRWAQQLTGEYGYHIEGGRLPIKNPARGKTPGRKFKRFDPYRRFRQLDKGDKVFIKHDETRRYAGQKAVVVRHIRSNSKRIVIETEDGKQWRWPMTWLTPQNK